MFWVRYSYFSFHKKGSSSYITRKRGVLFDLKISDLGGKGGVFLRKGGIFQTWARASWMYAFGEGRVSECVCVSVCGLCGWGGGVGGVGGGWGWGVGGWGGGGGGGWGGGGGVGGWGGGGIIDDIHIRKYKKMSLELTARVSRIKYWIPQVTHFFVPPAISSHLSMWKDVDLSGAGTGIFRVN